MDLNSFFCRHSTINKKQIAHFHCKKNYISIWQYLIARAYLTEGKLTDTLPVLLVVVKQLWATQASAHMVGRERTTIYPTTPTDTPLLPPNKVITGGKPEDSPG